MTWRRLGFVGLLGLLVAASPAPPQEGGVELAYLNRTYDNSDVALAPIREGPLAIRAQLAETPADAARQPAGTDPQRRRRSGCVAGGGVRGRRRPGGQRRGRIPATRLQDHVVAPRQVVQLRGKTRVTRDAQSYTLHVIEAPASVPVRIRSGVVSRCVAFCRALGLFAVADCARLQRSLSTVQVPLRSEQAALRIPRERLSATDRSYLDRFVRY